MFAEENICERSAASNVFCLKKQFVMAGMLMALYFCLAGYSGKTIYGEIKRFMAPQQRNPCYSKLMWSAVVAFLVTWYCIVSWMFMDSGGGGAAGKNVLVLAYSERYL